MCYTIFRPSLKAFATLLLVPLVSVMVGCGGSTSHSQTPFTPPPPGGTQSSNGTLSAIYVIPTTSPGIEIGDALEVVATAEYHYDPNVYKSTIVTQTATWSTSDSAVATVTKGLVIGVGMGRAIITVTFEGKTSTTLVVVGQIPSLAVKADGFSLAIGSSSFTLVATYPDGSVLDLAYYATWSSSDPGVLKFKTDWFDSPSDNTLIATGTTTVTATLSSGKAASLEVTVVP